MEIFEKRLRTFKPGFSEMFYPEKNWLLNQTFFHSKYWFRKSRLITSTKLSQLTTDPSTFFSTSDMDKFKKIRWHHWKQRLKISLKCQIWRWYVLSERKYSSGKLRKIRRLYGGGQVYCARHQTNVCNISRLWGAIISLVFNKSLSNLALYQY